MVSTEVKPEDNAPVDGMKQEEDEDDFSQSGDLTGDGGVIKEIVRKGEGWERPENGDDVEMHYKGTLEDGIMFDCSYERKEPFTFKLGDGKVIKGWDIVGKTMTKGEKARVTLKPEYGYGPQGSPPKIPGNATLVFEMELIGWHSKRDVYADGNVMKTEIASGEGWERPGKLAEVTALVTATTMDADGKVKSKVLYSGPRTFSLGVGEVPAVWDKVIQDMKKGARVSLICKPPHVGGPGVDFIPSDTPCVEYDITLQNWLKVEDIHSDGTLVKKVLKEGDGWERPKEGSLVTIDAEYSVYDMSAGKVKSDVPFLKSDNVKFVIGDGDVLDGLDRAVQSMKAKEVAIVTVFPQHAFKTAANLLTPEIIAKGVTESDVISVKLSVKEFDKAKDMWSMSFDEKADEMEARKKKGNDLIKVKRNELAKKSYERAVAFFDSPTSELDPELKKRVNQLLVQCHLNLSVCNNRLGDRNKVIEHCKKALEIEPSNIKALYRRGCAYLSMDDFYSAESDFKYAISLDPGNVDIRRKHVELKKLRAAQDKKDKKLYSNMFTRLSKMEKKEQATAPTSGDDAKENGDMAKTSEPSDKMEVDTKEAAKVEDVAMNKA